MNVDSESPMKLPVDPKQRSVSAMFGATRNDPHMTIGVGPELAVTTRAKETGVASASNAHLRNCGNPKYTVSPWTRYNFDLRASDAHLSEPAIDSERPTMPVVTCGFMGHGCHCALRFT